MVSSIHLLTQLVLTSAVPIDRQYFTNSNFKRMLIPGLL